MNIENSILSEIPKFIILRHPNVKIADIHNITFNTLTREKSLYGLRRDNFRDARLGYTQYFETMSEKKAYRNNIENSELAMTNVQVKSMVTVCN